MAIKLNTKPGINGANVLSIPKDWDPTWFRHFIHNSLKGADVRNAIGAGGITVTGNISSPYATISGAGITGTPAAPFNSVQFNNAGAFGGSADFVFSSQQITLNRTGDGTSINFERSTVLGAQIGFGNAFSGGQFEISTDGSVPLGIGATGAVALNLYTNSANRLNISSAGAVSIAAPSSGITLSVNGAGETLLVKGDTAILSFRNSANTGVLQLGSVDGWIGSGGNVTDAAIGAIANLNFYTGAHTTAAASIDTNGIATFSGGTATVSGAAVVLANFGIESAFLTKPAFVMNASGPNFGYVANVAAGQWGLGYGTSETALGSTVLTWTATGGIQIGAPTGGDQGAGTVNATGYFLNGSSLSAPSFAVATATETRTSTTTGTNSTQLTFAIPAAGTYAIQGQAAFTAGIGSGFACGLNYSGTFTAVGSFIAYLSMANGTTAGSFTNEIAAAATTVPASQAGVISAPNAGIVVFHGTLIATGAGTISMSFAQQASSANPTTLNIGSYLSITKIH